MSIIYSTNYPILCDLLQEWLTEGKRTNQKYLVVYRSLENNALFHLFVEKYSDFLFIRKNISAKDNELILIEDLTESYHEV
jgi:hypothetical protein